MKNLLEKHKYVKIQADYFSTGIWNANGDNVEVGQATSNPELNERISAWQAEFDKNDPFTPMTNEEIVIHMNEGLEIGKLLKEEHPTWHVALFNINNFFKGALDKKGNLIIDESFITA